MGWVLGSTNDFSNRLQFQLAESVEMDCETNAGRSADPRGNGHGRGPAEADRDPNVRARRGMLVALHVHPARPDVTTPASSVTPVP